MRDRTTRQINRTKVALWAIGAFVIISGISIDNELDRQKLETAEQKTDEAVQARQTAENERDGAETARNDSDAETARIRAENDELRRQLAAQTGAEAEPVISTPVTGSTPPSVSPSPLTDTITPITQAIDPALSGVGCSVISPVLPVTISPLLACYNKNSN